MKTPKMKIALNNLTNQLKEPVKEYRNQKWSNILKEFTTEDQRLWKIIRTTTKGKKKIILSHIKNQDDCLITNNKKAEKFAVCGINFANRKQTEK